MAKFIPDMRVGSEYTLKIVIKKEDGTPENITGYKFWLTLKAGADLATAAALNDDAAGLQESTTVGANTADDAINGIAYLVISSEKMKTVPVGDYFYDVQAKKPGNSGLGITTLLPPITDVEDMVTVFPEITKAIS